jgi:hypothetical protein
MVVIHQLLPYQLVQSFENYYHIFFYFIFHSTFTYFYFCRILFIAMAPKKPEVPEVKPLIGRVGTNLKIGIVGVPNGKETLFYNSKKINFFHSTLIVGKSTFFNVLTKSAAPAENFPFCTIDPNESRVPVPDDRWEFLCEYHKPARLVMYRFS